MSQFIFTARNGIHTNPTGDLRYADAETKAIAALFDQTQILRGDQATTENVIAATANAGTIHFACHGVIDVADPSKTGLLLASETQAVSASDVSGKTVMRSDRAVFFLPGAAVGSTGKILPLSEICHRMKLSRTGLVVLSACDSGWVATDGAADEFVGLPAAFLQAGANAGTSSLWLVDDAVSMQLITDFYNSHFRKGLTPAQALRQAQTRMAEQGISPYFWGGFILTGSVYN